MDNRIPKKSHRDPERKVTSYLAEDISQDLKTFMERKGETNKSEIVNRALRFYLAKNKSVSRFVY